MKIPKQFIFFLVLAQIMLSFGHFALYLSLTVFFPAFATHHTSVLWMLMFLSVSFLAISILDFKHENFLIRWLYIAAALWLPTWFYLLGASLLSIIIFLIFAKSLAGPLFLAAIALSLYGIINARITRIKTISVKLPNLPDYWKGKTAVLVTDLHLGHVLRHGFAKKIMRIISGLRPDIVFISGDFFDGVKTNFSELAKDFSGLKPAHGVYFCSGNHELFAGMAECEQALAGAGIKILENEKVEINGLQIAGTAYDMQETDEPLAKILNKIGIDKTKPSILLKHVPDHLQTVSDAGVSLQLSGHTHQAQLWPGRYITKKVFGGFDYGLKKIGSMQVYTSSGCGTWGPPMRTFTASEIIKITFI